MRRAFSLLLALALGSSPALAQRPIQESARKAAASQANTGSGAVGRRGTFMTGALLGIAGGTAIVLGGTALRTSKATSGNTPAGAYDACVGLRTNPVYRTNDCDPLRGPNKAVVIGGLAAAATGVTLMMIGASMSSVEIGPAGVRVQHRIKF